LKFSILKILVNFIITLPEYCLFNADRVCLPKKLMRQRCIWWVYTNSYWKY